ASRPHARERMGAGARRRPARAEPLRELGKRELGLLGREEAEHLDAALARLLYRCLGRHHSSPSESRSVATTRSACSSSITSGGDITIFWPLARTTTPRSSAPAASRAASTR